MCYHVSNESDAETIQREFKLPMEKLEKFKERYDFVGFERPYFPIISVENPKKIEVARWKLIPKWVENDKTWKANTLNARNDELFEKSSYKNYWRNRCLVICTGFFEPHYPDLTKDEHESWYIKPKNKKYFVLGGIYNTYNGEKTVSIVTTDASPLLAKIHNDGERQPLVLKGDAALAWLIPSLNVEEMKNLMEYKYPDEELVTYRTIDGVYNARKDTNVPEAILPYERPAFDVLAHYGVE